MPVKASLKNEGDMKLTMHRLCTSSHICRLWIVSFISPAYYALWHGLLQCLQGMQVKAIGLCIVTLAAASQHEHGAGKGVTTSSSSAGVPLVGRMS